MRVHSASVENAFVQGRRRARFTLPPKVLPGPFGVVIDPGVGFAPLSAFLAQSVAVGKGGGADFLRERSLVFPWDAMSWTCLRNRGRSVRGANLTSPTGSRRPSAAGRPGRPALRRAACNSPTGPP